MPPGVTSRKVNGATAGAGAGIVLAAFVVGMLDDHVYVDGDVPSYVSGLIYFAIPVALAWFNGYRTRRGADEILPPQRPGQHVRRVDVDDPPGSEHELSDEAGSAEPRDAAVIAALAVLVVILAGVLAHALLGR